MFLLHGEALLIDGLLKLLGGVALLALVGYVAWRSVEWGKRN
ncbi:MAG TPA: hypothetical protein VF508_05615 [Pyrinomonadaceae bacterium]|jgi:hypothetical protein